VDVSLLLLLAAAIAIAALTYLWLSTASRLRASAALAEARVQRLDAVFNTGVDGIVVIDTRGRVESFNRGAERLFGYSEAELIGVNVNTLMPSPYHEEHDGYLARYLATGDARIIGIGRQVTGRRKDGSTFPLHLSVGEMFIEGQRKFTGMLHDLSARVQLEERLREQAALVKLGEMAAVIAHEVKNPLAGVRGAIQVIGKRLEAGSPEAAVVGEVIDRLDALNRMMQDMLLFARPPQPKLAQVDVTGLLASTVGLLGSDPSYRALQVEIEGATPSIAGDPDLLKIVFLNLLMNGAQAMQGRGRMRVGVEMDERACTIRFCDYGPGIAVDLRDKVFTPFFTTKSRGTGLGLPTVRRLVEAHRGTVDMEHPPGGGAIVTVTLPLGATS